MTGINMEVTDQPLVSIITPVRNGAEYIEACIQSSLNQSYPHTEHIFIDGCSTDDTLKILASYQAKYPERIKFTSGPDKGACDAWNKGWEIASGEIFGWLGSDDTYEPDAVMTAVKFFRVNPNVFFVFGGCNFIDENSRITGKHITRDFIVSDCINSVNFIPAPSAFYKREVIERIGVMDTSINSCDRDYWIRVGKIFQMYRIDNILSNLRRHKRSISVTLGERGGVYLREDYLLNRRYHGRTLSLVVLCYWLDRIKVYNWLSRWLFPILRPLYYKYITRKQKFT